MMSFLKIIPGDVSVGCRLSLDFLNLPYYIWYVCCFLIHSDLIVSGRVPPWCSANDDPVNCTDDTADEIMERIVRSATQGPSQRTQPRERRRSRANRKSCESRQLLDKWHNLLSRRQKCYQLHVCHVPFICLPVCTVRRTLKNGLTTEEANALGLSSGSEMQVWAGHKDVWKPFHCPSNAYTQPGNPLHSGLALKSPPHPPALMSWPHLYAFGLHQLDTSASWREWIKGGTRFYSWADGRREQKQSAAVKPLSFAIAG